MNNYELMTIGKIDLGEKNAKSLSQNIQNIITSLGGKIEKFDFWGKRKFAYPIKHDTEGFYSVIQFNVDPSSINELKTKLNLENGLVRYLITAVEAEGGK
jgi:small subunit ribosomal protein S6